MITKRFPIWKKKKIIAKLVFENDKLSKRCNDLESVNNRLVERVVSMERNHWQSVQKEHKRCTSPYFPLWRK